LVIVQDDLIRFASDEKIDLIICLFHVLEHIPDPIEFLRDLINNFGKSIYFLIEVPILELEFVTEQIFDASSFFAPFHVTHFTQEVLTQVFTEAGLTISSSYSFPDYNGNLSLLQPRYENDKVEVSNNPKMRYNIDLELISSYMEKRTDTHNWISENITALNQKSDVLIFWGLGVGFDAINKIYPADSHWVTGIFVDISSESCLRFKQNYPQAVNVFSPEMLARYLESRKSLAFGLVPCSYAKSREINSAFGSIAKVIGTKFISLIYPNIRSY
jgi:hypothetical protein